MHTLHSKITISRVNYNFSPSFFFGTQFALPPKAACAKTHACIKTHGIPVHERHAEGLAAGPTSSACIYILGTDDTDTQAYVIFLRDPALLSNSPPQYQTVSD